MSLKFSFKDVQRIHIPITLGLSTMSGGRLGRDRMVVGFTTTYTIPVSTYHHWSWEFEPRSGEVYSIQHYVIKFVSYLRQVGSFLWALRSPPPIKVALTTINQTNQTINDEYGVSIRNIVSYMSSSISTIRRYELLYVVMETTK
jgi:hypothetical protein